MPSFMDSLQWVDRTYTQKHESEKPSSLRGLYYPHLSAYPKHGDTSGKKTPIDAALAFLSRCVRRTAVSLTLYILSFLPVVGRFIFPMATYYTFNRAVGLVPAFAIFGSGVFLPRKYLVIFLQSYFASRGLVRELVRDPPFYNYQRPTRISCMSNQC